MTATHWCEILHLQITLYKINEARCELVEQAELAREIMCHICFRAVEIESSILHPSSHIGHCLCLH